MLPIHRHSRSVRLHPRAPGVKKNRLDEFVIVEGTVQFQHSQVVALFADDLLLRKETRLPSGFDYTMFFSTHKGRPEFRFRISEERSSDAPGLDGVVHRIASRTPPRTTISSGDMSLSMLHRIRSKFVLHSIALI